MRDPDSVMVDICNESCNVNTPQSTLDRLWLEWFRATAQNIEPARLAEMCKAEQTQHCFIQPCKVGEYIFILTDDAPYSIEVTRVKQIRIHQNSYRVYANCIHDDWGWAYWELLSKDFNKIWFTDVDAAVNALIRNYVTYTSEDRQDIINDIKRQIDIQEKKQSNKKSRNLSTLSDVTNVKFGTYDDNYAGTDTINAEVKRPDDSGCSVRPGNDIDMSVHEGDLVTSTFVPPRPDWHKRSTTDASQCCGNPISIAVYADGYIATNINADEQTIKRLGDEIIKVMQSTD